MGEPEQAPCSEDYSPVWPLIPPPTSFDEGARIDQQPDYIHTYIHVTVCLRGCTCPHSGQPWPVTLFEWFQGGYMYINSQEAWQAHDVDANMQIYHYMGRSAVFDLCQPHPQAWSTQIEDSILTHATIIWEIFVLAQEPELYPTQYWVRPDNRITWVLGYAHFAQPSNYKLNIFVLWLAHK